MRDLKDIRVEIDKIDKQILSLFNQRMNLTDEVADYKRSVGKPVYDKVREDEKLEALSANADDSFSKKLYMNFTHRLCLSVEKSSLRYWLKSPLALAQATLL